MSYHVSTFTMTHDSTMSGDSTCLTMSQHLPCLNNVRRLNMSYHVSTFTMSQQYQETQQVSTLAPLPPITAKSNTIAVNYNSRKLFL